MLSREDARRHVEEYLARRFGFDEHLVAIQDDITRDIGDAWVFFYQSKAFLASGSLLDALAGNAPLIVDKQNGAVLETGTAYPLDYYIERFRISGDPHVPTRPPLKT